MVPIPRFPDFRCIVCADRTALERWSEECGEPSDFGFSSLIAWNDGMPGGISRLGGNLVVRFQDYCSDDVFYSFIGTDAVIDTARTLLAHARQIGISPSLKLIPEAVVAAGLRSASNLTVKPDCDQFDYIYDVDDWAAFTDARLGDNRRLLRRCQERSGATVRAVSLRDEPSRVAINELFLRWAAEKALTEKSRQRELAALRRLLDLRDLDLIEAQGFFAGDRLVGFLIWEGLPGGESAVAHFQKADRSFPGLSCWQVHALGQELQARGVRRINFEQDLGIPGLRQFKMSLGPSRLLEKYVVSTDDLGAR